MKYILAALVILSCVACDRVPPAHRGKVLMPAGYQPEVLTPGKYWTGLRGEMVLIETATDTMTEPMEVIMSDKLTLRFDVRFRAHIDGSDQVLNAMFDDIIPNNNRVTLKKIYDVYGRMIIRNKAREVLSEYTVEDVHKNYSKISSKLALAIMPALESTPLKLSDIALGNIKYPDIVTRAVERAEEKRQQIEQEKAQAEIALTKKENERRLAEADYQIKITKAKAIRDENKLIAEGITDELIEVKRLELLERIAMQNNNGTIVLPVEALTNIGAQMKMFETR